MKKRGLLFYILIFALVVTLTISGAFAALIAKRHSGTPTNQTDLSQQTIKARTKPTSAYVFLTMDPITSNVETGNPKHIKIMQVRMSLAVTNNKTANQLRAFLPKLSHEANILMSSRHEDEVGTLEFRKKLLAQMRERFNIALGASSGEDGPIAEVLFDSYIVY